MYNKLNAFWHLAVLVILAITPFTACSQPNMSEILRSQSHNYQVVTVAQGLENPWAMAFLPNGDMLVTERPGRLRIVRNGQLLETPVSGVPKVRDGGQGGLLDLILHPKFEENKWVYISYSKPNADASESTTAVIRARYQDGALTEVQEIFEAKAWLRGRGHYGCRLAFDKDGYLFITIGDRQVAPRGDLAAHPAQDLKNHQGTTVRLFEDGRIPPDNPFVGRSDALPEIWSYGHRNAQGMAIHPETNQVWLNEHGPQGGDELNLVKPAVNYGWPVIGYGVNYGIGTAIHETSQKEGMEQPAHYWVPSIATSGFLIYTGEAFPAWKGNFFIGGLAGEQLARLTMQGEKVLQEETLVKNFGRIRDVRQGPDGFIYLAIDSRAGEKTPILRIEPR